VPPRRRRLPAPSGGRVGATASIISASNGVTTTGRAPKNPSRARRIVRRAYAARSRALTAEINNSTPLSAAAVPGVSGSVSGGKIARIQPTPCAHARTQARTHRPPELTHSLTSPLGSDGNFIAYVGPRTPSPWRTKGDTVLRFRLPVGSARRGVAAVGDASRSRRVASYRIVIARRRACRRQTHSRPDPRFARSLARSITRVCPRRVCTRHAFPDSRSLRRRIAYISRRRCARALYTQPRATRARARACARSHTHTHTRARRTHARTLVCTPQPPRRKRNLQSSRAYVRPRWRRAGRRRYAPAPAPDPRNKRGSGRSHESGRRRRTYLAPAGVHTHTRTQTRGNLPGEYQAATDRRRYTATRFVEPRFASRQPESLSLSPAGPRPASASTNSRQKIAPRARRRQWQHRKKIAVRSCAVPRARDATRRPESRLSLSLSRAPLLLPLFSSLLSSLPRRRGGGAGSLASGISRARARSLARTIGVLARTVTMAGGFVAPASVGHGCVSGRRIYEPYLPEADVT